MKPKSCIGFEPWQGECLMDVSPDSFYWCERCEKLRIEHIDKQFNKLLTPRPEGKEGG